MDEQEEPGRVIGPVLCPGSGAWAGWGWSWKPCPECHARIDVDEHTLTIKPHGEKIDDWLRARTVED